MNNSQSLNIVFLHGWGMNRGIWTPFIQYVESRQPIGINLYALDLPGYGESINISTDGYDIAAVSAMVSKQLRPATVLIGWSMGGLIAQQIADTGNDNVLACIHICSSPKFVQETNWAGIKPEVLAMFTDAIKHDHVALLKRFLAIQCLGLAQPKQQLKVMFDAISEYPLSSPHHLQNSLRLLIETDLRPAAILDSPKVPRSLRIFGGLDTLVSAKNIDKIKGFYPQDDIVLIQKASHAPFISHQVETFEAIENFIHSLSGQSRFKI